MNIKKKLVKFEYNSKIFYFTYETNPLTGELDPHIWLRHLIEPETVIKAFFEISEQTYNEKHERYEAYSEAYNLEIYYNYIANKDYKVLIITAAKPR